MSFLFLSKVLRHTFHWFFASECLSRVLGLFWTQFWNAMKCHSGCHSTGFTSPTPFVFSLSTDYWITRTFHKKEKRRKKKLRQKIWEINLSFLLFLFFFFFSFLFLWKVLHHTFHWFLTSQCLRRVLGLFSAFCDTVMCLSGCHGTVFFVQIVYFLK